MNPMVCLGLFSGGFILGWFNGWLFGELRHVGKTRLPMPRPLTRKVMESSISIEDDRTVRIPLRLIEEEDRETRVAQRPKLRKPHRWPQLAIGPRD